MSVFGVILVQMWENTDQNNSEYQHFSHSEFQKFLQNEVNVTAERSQCFYEKDRMENFYFHYIFIETYLS